MFATILASMSMLASMQSADVPPQRQPSLVASVSFRSATSRPASPTDNKHLEIARRAMANGDFDIARREYSAAAAVDRAAGELPVEAVNGLAHALYSQSYAIEAAIALQQLVDEATALGDVNTAARALADVIWLNGDAGRRILARTQSKQLRTLLKSRGITDETRRLVQQRLG